VYFISVIFHTTYNPNEVEYKMTNFSYHMILQPIFLAKEFVAYLLANLFLPT